MKHLIARIRNILSKRKKYKLGNEHSECDNCYDDISPWVCLICNDISKLLKIIDKKDSDIKNVFVCKECGKDIYGILSDHGSILIELVSFNSFGLCSYCWQDNDFYNNPYTETFEVIVKEILTAMMEHVNKYNKEGGDGKFFNLKFKELSDIIYDIKGIDINKIEGENERDDG